MDQKAIIQNLERRATAIGLTMKEACRRAGIAPTTPIRWKNGKVSATFNKLKALDTVISKAERIYRAGVQ